jgi:hypothetical protein
MKLSLFYTEHLRTIPAKFGLIWDRGYRGKYLNMIFYQNMPNLHNLYKSAERKNYTEKNRLYVELLIVMHLHSKIHPILTYNKAAIDN